MPCWAVSFGLINIIRVGIHWRKQSVLHQSRGMVGLGIRSVRFMNEALLMKQVWRIHKKPHQLLLQCYASSRISLCATSTMPSNLSWGAKGLCHARHALRRHCVRKIGDGTAVLAARDRWVNGHVPVFRDAIPLTSARSMKVADFILPQGQGWNQTRFLLILTLLVHSKFWAWNSHNCHNVATLSIDL